MLKPEPIQETFGSGLLVYLQVHIAAEDNISFEVMENNCRGKFKLNKTRDVELATEQISLLEAPFEEIKNKRIRVNEQDPLLRIHFINYNNSKLESSKKFECGLCHKEFARNYQLINHLPVHSKVKKFKCDTCGKAFGHKATLSNHKARHSEIKPYACEECGKTFSRVSSIITHKEVHVSKQLKSHKCSVCGKAFTSKCNLKYHIYTHLNKKPYQCVVCDKGFSQPSNLSCHMLKCRSINDGIKIGAIDTEAMRFIRSKSFQPFVVLRTSDSECIAKVVEVERGQNVLVPLTQSDIKSHFKSEIVGKVYDNDSLKARINFKVPLVAIIDIKKSLSGDITFDVKEINYESSDRYMKCDKMGVNVSNIVTSSSMNSFDNNQYNTSVFDSTINANVFSSKNNATDFDSLNYTSGFSSQTNAIALINENSAGVLDDANSTYVLNDLAFCDTDFTTNIIVSDIPNDVIGVDILDNVTVSDATNNVNVFDNVNDYTVFDSPNNVTALDNVNNVRIFDSSTNATNFHSPIKVIVFDSPDTLAMIDSPNNESVSSNSNIVTTFNIMNDASVFDSQSNVGEILDDSPENLITCDSIEEIEFENVISEDISTTICIDESDSSSTLTLISSDSVFVENVASDDSNLDICEHEITETNLLRKFNVLKNYK